MGVIWTAFGLVFREEMSFFLIIGLVFMIIGLANKDKWKKNHRTFKDMGKDEKKYMIWIMIFLGSLFLAGLIVFFLVERGII